MDIFDDKNKLPEHLKNMLKKKKMLTIIINKKRLIEIRRRTNIKFFFHRVFDIPFAN